MKLEGMFILHGWRDSMRFFANVDEEGNIIQSTYGEFVVDPDNYYEHHLVLKDKKQVENLHKCKIINGQLVKLDKQI